MSRPRSNSRASRRAVVAAGIAGALFSVPLVASGAGAAAISHQVSVPVISAHPGAAGGWASGNWSGYAITGGPFTAITGGWTVPKASPTPGGTYSSSWIGIDGFNDQQLIQTGTEQDYYNGAAHYNSWWEILPAPETRIPSVPVKPGDHMTASILRGAGNKWTIKISDTTTGKSFSIVKSYTGGLSSAEWIQEAPYNGGILPLAHYGKITFDPGTANGSSPNLASANGGVMIQHGKQVSTPSKPDSDKDGFTAAYGSVAPPPPPS